MSAFIIGFVLGALAGMALLMGLGVCVCSQTQEWDALQRESDAQEGDDAGC